MEPTQQPMNYRHWEHPKTCAADDFWGQVSRTVHGQPVSEQQIEMIVDAVLTAMQPTGCESILDLCCGNGALGARFVSQFDGYLGVDFSEYLIEVANVHFAGSAMRFTCADVLDYLRAETDPGRFDAALCYGAFSYLPRSTAELALQLLHTRFPRVQKLFLGNLPDRDRARSFFHDGIEIASVIDDPQSAIGIWRTKRELRLLAKRCGWDCEVRAMPDQYYGAHYRFDALLTRSS